MYNTSTNDSHKYSNTQWRKNEKKEQIEHELSHSSYLWQLAHAHTHTPMQTEQKKFVLHLYSIALNRAQRINPIRRNNRYNTTILCIVLSFEFSWSFHSVWNGKIRLRSTVHLSIKHSFFLLCYSHRFDSLLCNAFAFRRNFARTLCRFICVIGQYCTTIVVVVEKKKNGIFSLHRSLSASDCFYWKIESRA